MVFDIPFGKESLRRQVNRELSRMGANKLQQSVWKFDNLGSLISIANQIKKSGGEVRILEEKFIF